MTTETQVTQAETPPEDSGERAPNPQDNPRNSVLSSIAKTAFSQHAEEAKENSNIPVQAEDGTISEPVDAGTEPQAPHSEDLDPDETQPPVTAPVEVPPAQEPPAVPGTQAINPDLEYDVIVEGTKMKVKGQQIIDAGFRTFQKETAADFRLRTASQLLEEAERRFAATPPGAGTPPTPAPPGGKTEAELAQMLQFGNAEQSAEAVRILRESGATPQQISELAAESARAAARDEVAFQSAKRFLNHEYGDLLANDSLRALFASEENRLRESGDKRPYGDLYKAIGDKMRTDFAMPKPGPARPAGGELPPGTPAARVAAKKAAPSVPRTAAARLGEGGGTKTPSTTDVIARMAAQRGQGRLTPARKE